jgi:HAD superfamily hydrolase (TIGR01549 family)
MPLKFLYFDLGQVLLKFDVGVMCRQVASVAQIDPADVFRVILCTPLQRDYELGRISSRQFYDEFCRHTRTRPDYDALLHAACDFFELNTSIVPVLTHLGHAGYRLGILSNTCEGHWEHCSRRYALLRELFDVYILSYRIGTAKPDPAIYQSAAKEAGVAPQDIFFTDDVPGHVEAARASGFDAVQFASTPELVEGLRARSIRFNY